MGDTPPDRSGQDGSNRLRQLDARIKSARDAKEPPLRANGDKFSNAGMAWRMVVELTLSMVVGAAMGWGLDSLFGTTPFFLIVFWLLGFASGIRTVMHSAKEFQNKQVARAARDQHAASAAEDNRGPGPGA